MEQLKLFEDEKKDMAILEKKKVHNEIANDNKDKKTEIVVKFGKDSKGKRDYMIGCNDLMVSCHSSGISSGFPNGLNENNFNDKLKADINWIKDFLLENGFLEQNIKISYFECN